MRLFGRLRRAATGLPGLGLFVVTYAVVVAAAIAFGLIASGQGGGPSPSASPGASAAASSAPVVAETLSGRIGAINNADGPFLLAVATLFVVIPGAVILFGLALFRLCRILLREQLVLADVIDGTGFEFKEQLAGLSQLMREGVYQASVDFRTRYRLPGGTRKALMPAQTTSADLTSFVGAVKGSAPTQVGSLLAVIPALFPSAGTGVDCYLARAAGSPFRLSLSVRIARLSDGSGVVLESVVGKVAGASKDDVLNQGSGFAGEAARWLTILLIKRSLIGSDSVPNARNKDRHLALCHNLIGFELLELAGSVKVLDPDPLYLQSIQAFKDAEASDPTWYMPAENLADAMSYLGALRGAASLQWDSLKQYSRALELAKAAKEGGETEERIELSRAITQLCTSDPVEIAASECVSARFADIATLYKDKRAETLYTVACWFGVHARMPVAGDRFEADVRGASMALAYALALRPDFAEDASADPDVNSIREIAARLADAAGWLSMPERTRDSIEKFVEPVVTDWLDQRPRPATGCRRRLARRK